MPLLSTGPIENDPVKGVRPSQQVKVKIENRNSFNSSTLSIRGFILNGTRTLYIEELISLTPNQVVTRRNKSNGSQRYRGNGTGATGETGSTGATGTTRAAGSAVVSLISNNTEVDLIIPINTLVIVLTTPSIAAGAMDSVVITTMCEVLITTKSVTFHTAYEISLILFRDATSLVTMTETKVF